MTGWMYGGAAGLLGLAGGIVMALWWRYKLAAAQKATSEALAKAALFGKDIEANKRAVEGLNATIGFMKANADKQLKEEAARIVRHQEELQRRDAEMEVMRATEKNLRALLAKHSNDPAVAAERVGGLFPKLPTTGKTNPSGGGK